MEKEKNMLEIVISVMNTIIIVAGAILSFGMGYHYMWYVVCFIACITTVIEKGINKKTNEKEFKVCLGTTILCVVAAVGYAVYKQFV